MPSAVPKPDADLIALNPRDGTILEARDGDGVLLLSLDNVRPVLMVFINAFPWPGDLSIEVDHPLISWRSTWAVNVKDV